MTTEEVARVLGEVGVDGSHTMDILEVAVSNGHDLAELERYYRSFVDREK